MRPLHYALVGPVGGGKTTALRRVAERFSGEAGGVLSVRVEGPEGQVVGYDLVPVPGDQRWPYARTTGPGIRVGRFWIREEVIQEVQGMLDRQRPRLWLLDEVGILELRRHRGWWPWLVPRLQDPRVPVVLTVRESLREVLLASFPHVAWRFYAPEDVERLMADLVRRLREG